MVNFCAVYGCSNRADRNKNIGFYRLPAVKANASDGTKTIQEERRMLWLRRIRRADLNASKLSYLRICSSHFLSGKPADLNDRNHPDWAPSQNLGYQLTERVDHERYSRACEREHKKMRIDSATALLALSQTTKQEATSMETSPSDSSVNLNAKETQTSTTMGQIEEMDKEIHRLMAENVALKAKLKNITLDEHSLANDNSRVLFYTGLPNWLLLSAVFDLVQPYLSQSPNCSLSPFQQLLLTLMRLRLNLTGEDLAWRFGGIHYSTVSRVFNQVVSVLYHRLAPLIIWPERDDLRATLPMDFRKHCPKCVVIIDCFEIFLDRASNPLARAQTYSSYKHHNTVKYLIGITPQGTVSYISNGWGGRTSDKHITENCGILNKLLPGDVILADRGFNIQESVGLYCATIKIPAFTKGKNQLTGIEVEQTRRIANVRIHVERIIGNLRKKYSLLSATQPIDFVIAKGNEPTTLDKIVTVGSALVNICDSVVSFE